MALINEKLWIGHFDITSKNGIPAYRHTVLSFPENEMLFHQLEDLVDIAIYECEKYYPAFQLVLFDDSKPIKALKVSTFDTIGASLKTLLFLFIFYSYIMNKILLIGCGHMGSALLKAWSFREKNSFLQ